MNYLLSVLFSFFISFPRAYAQDNSIISDTIDVAEEIESVQKIQQLRVVDLFDIPLSSGDVFGFDIDIRANTGRMKYNSTEWTSRGYKGVRFKGAGRGVTHMRSSGEHTIMVDRHMGTVWLEDMTIHCGSRTGIFFGLEHIGMATIPGFKLVLRNVEVVADPPSTGSPYGHTTVWPIFTNGADQDFKNVVINGLHSAEHTDYAHGFSDGLIRWDLVTVIASGAQQLKIRNSPTEVQFVPGARIIVTRSTFQNWYQPWTWRGGNAITMEGAHAGLYVDSCVFIGGGFAEGGPYTDVPASSRCFAIAVDDAGGDCYSVIDGAVGTGIANGHIIIKNSGFFGGPGTENLSKQIRVGGLGSGRDGANGRKVARSVTISNCAAYGQRLQFQFGDIPTGKLVVRGCNTPSIKQLAESLGFDTTFETLIPLSDRAIPVSTGLRR